MAPHAFRYLFGRKGKRESSVTQAGGFLKNRPELEAPDVQLHFLPLLYDDSGRDLKLMAESGYSCHACMLCIGTPEALQSSRQVSCASLAQLAAAWVPNAAAQTETALGERRFLYLATGLSPLRRPPSC